MTNKVVLFCSLFADSQSTLLGEVVKKRKQQVLSLPVLVFVERAKLILDYYLMKFSNFKMYNWRFLQGKKKAAYILNINHANLRRREVDAEGLLPVWHQLKVRYKQKESWLGLGFLKQSLMITVARKVFLVFSSLSSTFNLCYQSPSVKLPSLCSQFEPVTHHPTCS